MKDELVCGIDIGSSKIATIVGVNIKEDKEPRIIGFNSTPSKGVKKGLIVDIEEVTIAVEESVEKAERMAGRKINKAFVSVGGPHISSLNSRGIVAVSNPQSEIVYSDMDRAIDAAKAISLSNAKRIIEVSSRDYIVDGQDGIRNPIGMSGVRLEVETHIITASQTNLRNIDRTLEDLDIQNLGFVFAGLASAECVLTDTEKDLGVVLVDIGGGKIDLCIYIEGALSYSSSIPVGARHVTNDIAVGLRVSLDTAEKIKLQLEQNIASKKNVTKKKAMESSLSELHLDEKAKDISIGAVVDGIIAPRLEEIFKLVFEEIEKSGFGDSIPSGLVVTGGGALTVGILESGKQVVGLPIRIGTPQKVSGLIDEIIYPQYATCVGLILYAKGNIIPEENRINFNKVLKDFSVTDSLSKFKNLVKQFIP